MNNILKFFSDDFTILNLFVATTNKPTTIEGF